MRETGRVHQSLRTNRVTHCTIRSLLGPFTWANVKSKPRFSAHAASPPSSSSAPPPAASAASVAWVWAWAWSGPQRLRIRATLRWRRCERSSSVGRTLRVGRERATNKTTVPESTKTPNTKASIPTRTHHDPISCVYNTCSIRNKCKCNHDKDHARMLCSKPLRCALRAVCVCVCVLTR